MLLSLSLLLLLLLLSSGEDSLLPQVLHVLCDSVLLRPVLLRPVLLESDASDSVLLVNADDSVLVSSSLVLLLLTTGASTCNPSKSGVRESLCLSVNRVTL